MRRGLSTVPTLLILLIAVACTAGGSAGIRWEDTIEEALARSERDGKPVLLYFTFHG